MTYIRTVNKRMIRLLEKVDRSLEVRSGARHVRKKCKHNGGCTQCYHGSSEELFFWANKKG